MKKLLFISLLFTAISCTKSDEDSFKYSLGKDVIGKWDISNSAKNTILALFIVLYFQEQITQLIIVMVS